jgi:hypothetical protein
MQFSSGKLFYAVQFWKKIICSSVLEKLAMQCSSGNFGYVLSWSMTSSGKFGYAVQFWKKQNTTSSQHRWKKWNTTSLQKHNIIDFSIAYNITI